MVRKALAMLVLAEVAGCAPGLPSAVPSAPVPAPVAPFEASALASILQEEDQRSPQPVAVLEHARSPSPRVRTAAAIALGRLRHEPAVPVLIALTSDQDTAVAAAAAFALGQVGDTTAVEALAPLVAIDVAPERVTVADEAAYALGKVRSERSRRVLRSFLGEADLQSPVQAAVARSALLALWRFPRDGEDEPLPRWLRSRDPEVRWRATYAMVRRPDPRATPLLPGLVDDPDPRVRALAARGLTQAMADSSGVGSLVVRPLLTGLLSDPSYTVRISAIVALGTHQHPDAVRALVRLVQSAHPHESYAATESLGRLGDVASAAAPLLEARAADEGAPVALRRAALDALGRVAPGSAVRTARGLASSPHWQLRVGAAAALASRPDESLDALTRDRDPRVAAAALQARVRRAGESLDTLRATLVQALRSPDAGIRITALRALRQLADPSTLPALLDAYGVAAAEPANDVTPAALEAIAALRSPQADPARALFARFSRPSDPLVHQLAVQRFGDSAVRTWGEPLPIATGRTPQYYEEIVQRWVVPVLEGRGSPTMTVETASGTIELRLFSADAPLTVQSFFELASRGYFDGQEWPRVVPNFVVQGGDPTGDTSGGPGYSLRDEISRHRYGTGSLGMALSGPDTGGSQFFITHSPQPHLDGIYAVFGEVMEGMEITQVILPGETIRMIRVSR